MHRRVQIAQASTTSQRLLFVRYRLLCKCTYLDSVMSTDSHLTSPVGRIREGANEKGNVVMFGRVLNFESNLGESVRFSRRRGGK